MPSFTVPELAAYLRVSTTTIYHLVATRRIVFYRLGGSLRFFPDDAEAYARSLRVLTMSRRV